ncbi:MAG: cell division protein SepF [Fusobacterium gastrosuis]|uniref:cell division protein SepF n=1 Tax=Fusobacterium TaxID=848 RepID=UPI001F504066|nr:MULTISPECIES: cell division protein SepF [Fusobacterium]MDD7391906.1 cell division protein SepF [Fusobacteriaceae bacterium]MCI5724407.1 cell division protein SepF [Fusobacterium sp.]MCI7224489.1 cell division protein SepF [Fusobacterium sp.]MDD7409651.1 cell division protein SepF [Fusobacteriaceae bacterium]MDY4010770.1 cell division protein SepF [Fusobacterium gastrosuis]
MGLKDMFKDVKELVGINSIDDEIDEIEEYEEEYEEEAAEEIKKAPKKSLFSKKVKEELPEEDNFEEDNNYSTVFIDPKQFEDCKKIAKYIDQEKMITINLESVSPNVAQRIMDFLAGAMEIKNASFAQIAKNVYTIVPENMKVYYEGPKKKEKKLIDLERGEN